MNNLKRLYPYLQPHRKILYLAVACMVLNGALDGSLVFILEKVIRPVLDSNLAAGIRLHQLDFECLVLIAVAVGRAVTDYGQTYLTQKVGMRVLRDLRVDLFAHFQTLSVAYFERKRTGELMSRLTNDLSYLQSVITTAVVTTVAAPIAFLTSIAAMLYFNWRLSILVVVILPPIATLISLTGRRIREAVSFQQIQIAHLTNLLQEKLSAMRLIQTFGTQRFENKAFAQINDDTYRSTLGPIQINAALGPTIEFIGILGVLAALWYGSHDVIDGTMKSSALFAFLLAIQRAAMRVKALANLNLTFKSGEASATRLFEVLDTTPEIVEKPGAIQLVKAEVAGHLRFEKVRFAYGDGPDVLHDIDFEIKPGEVVALAGLSGSGKSTIAALVPRLYDPTHGRVTLDGRDLRDLKLTSLRDLIGAVPQDITLFHGTIRDNIAYGTADAPLDQIISAAKQAHADEFIRRRPEGYDAPTGERAMDFSGGQKQRLAIARALLRDPRLLILDEATSALDAESEGLVQDALAVLMRGRTTLIIAHRFSTIVNADRILVLDQGHIVEDGNHTQLLARKGLYHRLYQMQSFQARRGEEEAAAQAALEQTRVLELEKLRQARGAEDEELAADYLPEAKTAS